jgi:hypothetical protein
MAIREYLHNDAAFSPEDIKTMSHALEDACNALKVNGDAKAREAVAIRIIELARRGERDAANLRDRVVAEANGGAALQPRAVQL